ncbi:non-ribosomal peptide synthetase [Xanthomonas maliensis]|uniref:non-ribosomal peptide synthetase n=2 Tax=Xanthomonas maliensis TaxID=1321368 RepID=UPI0014793162|nr:non-ribosomal peptide synthetase [Xanthomonas maliensis]
MTNHLDATAWLSDGPVPGGIDGDGSAATLLDRFAAQVQRAPEAIALSYGQDTLTYRELHARAGQLAVHFQSLGVEPGCIVALCLERSPLLIASVLGLLRAGAAYLPIDPATPAARVAFMLEDSGARMVLTDADLGEAGALAAHRVVRLDAAVRLPAAPSATGPRVLMPNDGLAYVIYTSGSTGQPKGVLVPQSNVVALFDASQARFRFGPQDVWTLFHSYAFDFSVWEMWGALLYGGRLVIVPGTVNRDTEAFYELVSRERVTVLNQTPSAFSQFMAVDEAQRLALRLRLVIFGGEALRFGELQHWVERHGDTAPELVNMYGITETTVHVSLRRVLAEDTHQRQASLLGQALSHLSIHVLDERLQPVEDGCPGELYVSGRGLAWGYLNRSALTACRFIANPFATGERLYRSGDLARRTAEGDIEYLGRVDQQVKLRGFRIELGEIEAALLRHPAVRQAVVMLRQDDAQRSALVAYVVASNPATNELAARADDTVAQWQALYQETYRPADAKRGPDFTGWLSSYTGLPIGEADMQQWLQATANRLLARRPRRLLEIGCGLGLVLEQVAPHCTSYVATDLSSVAVSHVRQWLLAHEHLQHVSVRQQAAIEFSELPKDFDTVVLNSVIQYFPSIDYLLEVLRQAAAHVTPGGRIFVGDVRNYALLELFHASVQVARADDAMSVAQLQAAIDRSIRQEKELLVAPAFFQSLRQWVPTITGVHVLLKRGDAHNELNQYRYDVWLDVGDVATVAADAIQWHPQDDAPLVALADYLVQERPTRLHVPALPNARLAVELATLAQLRRCSPSCTVGELRAHVARATSPAVQPEEVWQLGERLGYEVALSWSENASGQLSAEFSDRSRLVERVLAAPATDTMPPAGALAQYANDPLVGVWQHALLRELRAHLREMLPAHMLPSATLLLPALPLTVNGKVDKARLPAPDQRIDLADYTEPHTPLQQTLAAIFAEVLRLDRVGLHDSFFELGGNSLLAMRIVTQVRGQLGVALPLRAIFEHATVAGIETVVDTLRAESSEEALPALGRRRQGEAIPLSFPQERLWFIEQLGLVGAAYHVPLAFRLHGQVQVSALRAAVADLVRRHEMLRTRLVVVGAEPQQVIDPAPADPLAIQDLRDLAPLQAQARVAELLDAEARHTTDLQRGPLFRACLLWVEDDVWVLILAAHHLAADGWSHAVIFRDLSALYRVHTQPGTPPLPTQALQYADYALWQRRWLTGTRLAQQLDYWTRQLADAPDLLALPTDRPRPAVASFRGALHRFTLPPLAVRRLPEFAHEQGVTPFMALLAAFQVLLSRWSGGSDIVVGTPTAGRTSQETEQIVGLFINTLALRAHIDAQACFGDILAQVKETALAAFAHQDAPFEQVVAALKPDRNLSRQPIVQVIFALQNTPPSELRLGQARITPLALPSSSAKYDLTLNLIQSRETLTGEIEYATDLFDATTIADLAQWYGSMLVSAMEQPERPVSHLRLFAAAPAHASEGRTADDCSVLDLFDAQVVRAPHAPAIESATQCLSYAELSAQSDRWARWLNRQGIARGDCVAVVSNQQIDTFLAMLAILKAGAAYLPINADAPTARRRATLQDACPRLVLADAAVLSDLPAGAIAFESIATATMDAAFDRTHAIGPSPAGGDLAYVIYTSGSTGRPKGVLLEHRGLHQLVLAQIERFAITPASRLLQFASLGFDASVSEVFTTLCRGACLCLPAPTDILAGDGLAQLLRARAITHVTLPPSAIPGLVQAGGAPTLHTLVVAGEACAAAIVRSWPTPVRFINAYGPTEATVCATLHICDPDELRNPPIGKPLPHVRLYVLDPALQPVPAGIAGEIHIGGTGVGRGYHGRAALTAERFIADPFGPPGTRMYRSGDRGRRRPDGTVEFLGRLDRQVKVRGYRIEPGDVESALLQLAGVGQALVLAQGELDRRRLIAYVVPAHPGAVTPESILADLRVHLPAYLVPASVIVLAQFPLTASGKIDQSALPAVDACSVPQTSAAPHTPTERQLAAIWIEVLGCQSPGVDDNFFALGGHSLLAARAVGRIRETMAVAVSVRDVFTASNLRDLARVIDELQVACPASAAPIPVAHGTRLPLSSIQQSLWMLDRLGAAGSAYAMPITLRHQGEVDVSAMQQALSEIVRRHEILRTTFVCDAQGPHCVVQPAQTVALEVHDLSALSSSDCARTSLRLQQALIERRFDLGRDLLLRGLLMQCADQQWLLCLTTHHIAADGWSITLLVEELQRLYTSYADGRLPVPPPPRMQYADYSVWQRDRWDESALEQHRRYWQACLADAPMVFELPADRPRPPVQSYRGALHRFNIPAELHRALAALSAAHGVTLYMTLLAAFNVLLHRLSGCRDILIGSPIATRMESELIDMIGPLLNTVVLRIDLSEDPTFATVLARARAMTLDAYEHQALPFEQLVDQLRPPRDLARQPLVQVLFSLQNQPTASTAPTDVWSRIDSPWSYAKYDLSLYITETADGLACEYEYATDLFDGTTIARWSDHLRCLLAAIVADPGMRASRLAIFDGVARNQLLSTARRIAGTGLETGSLPELVARQARRRPQALAVRCATRALTYAQLDEQSDGMAARLRRKGASAGQRVGLCVERSVDLVVAVLAVLKSGAAYVPLDPAYPQQRLGHMVRDSAPCCIVTDHASASRVAPLIAADCLLDIDQSVPPQEAAPLADAPPRSADSIAYIIYTSGSTGQPKGCVITDRGLLNLLGAMAEQFAIGEGDRLLAVTPYSFDIAGLELLLPLVRGACTHLSSLPQSRDARRLMQLVQELRPSIMQATPATWQMLHRAGWRADGTMRILCGGEALPDALRDQLAQAGSAWNMYGPTETTIWSTTAPLTVGGPTTIGTPIANTCTYVLDDAMQLVPVGVEGDLYIGGDGVARGYWNRPALTAQRFIADPFAVGRILYQTGDRARWRADGSLQYLGRRDTQIKLRGFRIELGEIEAALAKHPDVDACACVLRQLGEPQLVAAYVAATGTLPDRDALVRHLRAQLPEHMVPVDYIAVPALPLTANGKIDRQQIAGWPASGAAPRQVSSGGDIGQHLLAIWQQALGRQDLDIEEGFFAQGGTSLMAVVVAERIAAELQPGFDVTAIFEFGSIAKLAAHLQALAAAPAAHALLPAAIAPVTAAGATEPADAADKMPAYYADSVAIIGISCAFPGARNAEEFWSNLLAGKESIERIPEEELRQLGIPAHVLADPRYVPVRSELQDRALFDAAFFNISERDAQLMDPQLRLLLMHAWRAIEDAGYNVEDVARCAVYATASTSAYHARQLASASASAQSIEQYVGWIMAQNGTLPAVISNKLGLVGPSLFVHSNCSSSLSALDLAHRRLLEGEWPYALVAAARVASFEGSGYVHQDGMNFSSDGHLRAFDAAADGAVGGEGVAVLLLKRAHAAIADGDPIYAILRATATNNDGGHSAGFYAPSVVGQRAVVQGALAASGIDPATIGYVEAHGTGTPLGDPIELAALSQAYGTAARQACGIGSVKTNIGHLDTAAGLAGCIKVALSLSRGAIPASLHFVSPNPALKLEQSPFFVVDAVRRWQGPMPYRAAVSAMGVGGSNAHAILEACVARPQSSSAKAGPWLFPLSAHDPTCLRVLAEQLLAFVARHPDLALCQLAYTLQVGRKPMPYRLAISADDAAQLQARLRQYLQAPTAAVGVRCGHVATVAPHTDDTAAAELTAALARWAQQGHHDMLASLWVNGFVFDWRSLYGSTPPRRLNAPVYPFNGKHFWLDAPATQAAAATTAAQPVPDGVILFAERWEPAAPSPLPWDHLRYLVLCDFPSAVQWPVTQPTPGLVVRTLPRTADSLGHRFMEHAAALLELLKDAAAAAPAMVQVVVPDDADGAVCAALVALLYSAKREYDRLEVQLIQMPCDAAPDAIARLRSAVPDRVRERRETSAAALRRRFVPLPRQPQQPPMPTPWRDGGRYLITGGGRLGIGLAREMAATLSSGVLVVVGRSAQASELATELSALRTATLQVDYRRADVTDRAAVQAVLQHMRERYGGVDGIIHTAGVLDDGYIARKQRATLQRVLAPKVLGLEHLDACLGSAPLDFLICFGSVSGAVGSAGQCDYATANAFMRSFAVTRNARAAQGQCCGRTLCIDWPYWRDGGMRLSAHAEAELVQAGLVPLETAAGIEALSRAWHSGESSVSVLAGAGVEMAALFAQVAERAGDRPVTPPASDASELSRLTLQRLIAVFAEVSRIDPARIDGSVPLETFSIDSIMIAQLNQRLGTTFPGLSKTLFYQFTTLQAIADELATRHADACVRWTGQAATVAAAVPMRSPAIEQSAAAAPRDPCEPIAIIGLAGQYPHARTLEAFWQNLRAGRDCIDEIPSQRWSLDGFFCEDPQQAIAHRKSYSRWGGFLEGFADFDPLFFSIAPAEAMDMDPQERLFLQACWQALEDGHHTRQTLASRYGGRVGVFVGITKTGFELHGRDLAAQGSTAMPYTSFGSVANRVSYLLDLNGPSFPIDTMCSASLTAIHEACEHLRRDECALALAGGVNLYLHPSTYVGLCSQRMLSTDGRCRSFGAHASGFVPGEGVGAVLLKPLSAAQRDGDTIHGVILGSGINHGGRTHGYTVPNPRAQRDLIQRTLARCGLDAADISYVEAHGTGTEMGDPIEVEGLAQAFAAGARAPRACALGSVKSNIGHLEAAAGIAGLTKVLLQFKHGELVPTLHCADPNPNLALADTPFVLQHQVAPWTRPLRADGAVVPRIATVSSFGAGGANAFLVVQEAPSTATPTVALRQHTGWPALIVMSARRPDRLADYARALQAALAQGAFSDADLPAIAATLQLGREAMEYRLAFAARSLTEAIDCLQQYLQDPQDRGAVAVGKRMASAPAQAEGWQTGPYAPVLAAWTRGAETDWSSLYDGTPARVRLPTYPFAQESYWPVAATPQPQRADDPARTTPALGGADVQATASEDLLLVPDWVPIAAPAAVPIATSVLVIGAAQAPLPHSDAAVSGMTPIPWSGAAALRQQLVERAVTRVIWFAPQPPQPSPSGLLQEATVAAVQCVELLQTLAAVSGPGRPIDLVAVTHQSHPAADGECPDPAQAAVVACLRSAAKEYRHGALAVVDRAPAHGPDLEALLAVRAHRGRASVYAFRQDRWLCQQLTPLRVNARRASVLPDGGVHLLVGGAGHVGRHLSAHLLQRAAALVWIGRRPAAEVQEALAQFASDPRLSYYQADASDPQALRRVRAEVLARHRRIDAVLVATTDFSLVPLTSLSPVALHEAFAAKVGPAVAVAETFGGDAREGLIFLSSLVVYLGNRAQAHYAAACAWQDAFARALSLRGIKARVMNWGYWTIDDPHRSEELHDIGIAFIDAASGGAALDILRAGPFDQLGFLRTRAPLAIEGLNLQAHLVLDGEQIRRVQLPPSADASGHDQPLPGQDADEAVRDRVANAVCRTLAMDRQLLDEQAPFAEYGLDSILGLKLVRAINHDLGIALPGPCLFDHPSVERLTAHIRAVYPDAALPARDAQPATLTAARPAPSSQGDSGVREPIAIIGMSGRFPQSEDADALWQHLAAGRDLVEPATRWPEPDWQQDDDTQCRHAGYIADVAAFDPLFFRISRADALQMDPQQRLCLEEAWKALENAGYAGRAVSGKDCGVYIGCSGEDYTQLVDGELPVAAMHGSSTALLSSRIAYHLDLHGPAMTVDTACSSGLVAIHLACQALWMGEIALAIAGGVHVQCTAGFHVLGSRAGMLSPQGRCFTFDARANGFVPADGVGIVVLKRLSAALADGDHIVGVIAGSAINQDGTSNGLTAPSASAQEQLASQVYARFGIDVANVQMAEAHGTGTVLGDPIEVQALTRAFRRQTDRVGYCAIGSVKSNLGHAAEAAGLAGLFKILLSLRHRQLPPTLHYQTANPHIDFANSPFFVNTRLRDWPAPAHGPRRAVLSAFGLSGTNAHLVIEEAPATPSMAWAPVTGRCWLMALSARTTDQLRSAQQRLHDHLITHPALSPLHLSHTLLQGRHHFDHRWCCVAGTIEEVVQALGAALATASAQSTARADSSARAALHRQAQQCVDACAQAQDRPTQLARLAELFLHGATPDFAPLFAAGTGRVPLPTYPFARERYWLGDAVVQARQARLQAAPPPPPLAATQRMPATEGLSAFIVEFLERTLMLKPGELSAEIDLQELGVDSLVSMRLMRDIRHRYGIAVSGRELFDHRSVASLVAHLAGAADDIQVALPPVAGAVATLADEIDALLDAFEAGELSVDALEQRIGEGAAS